ncbi:hypothetical protein [Streptomyces sp. NPDC053728]|uniref:hypothetical protein n=1 Tax=Streptomyces sp. NPDC053728 TaxID=3155534 RepID=UPI00343B1E3A
MDVRNNTGDPHLVLLDGDNDRPLPDGPKEAAPNSVRNAAARGRRSAPLAVL